MGGTGKVPGPIGAADAADAPHSSLRAPSGPRLRFPTLELFAVTHGAAFSGNSRPLTTREKELAQPIFQQSVMLDPVRIVEGQFANAPTTLGNYVRIAPHYQLDDSTLIHELTHVWQFQTRGSEYISNSLCHQVAGMISSGDRNAAYHLTVDEVADVRSIYELPAEKQAVAVELYFISQSNNPHFQRLIREVRAARPIDPNLILEEAAFGSGAARRFDELSPHPLPHIIPLIRLDF